MKTPGSEKFALSSGGRLRKYLLLPLYLLHALSFAGVASASFAIPKLGPPADVSSPLFPIDFPKGLLPDPLGHQPENLKGNGKKSSIPSEFVRLDKDIRCLQTMWRSA